MRLIFRRAVVATFIFIFVLQAAAMAAVQTGSLMGIRFHGNEIRDRIVFDLSGSPQYTVTKSEDGKEIVIEFADTAASIATRPDIKSDMIRQVSFVPVGNKLRVTISLNEAAACTVQKLANPSRVFIDIPKEYERVTSEDAAPGLKHTTYIRKDGEGMLTAHLLEIDRSRYKLQAALAKGEILGCEKVSGISDDTGAVAAINASYFAPDGEIIGITKIDGTIVSTTYFTRTGFAVFPDGTAAIGSFGYNGTVTIGKVTVPVSGVDCERGENNLIIYNRYFDGTTGTNEFGREFVVQAGRVTAINSANSPIPVHGVVISVHGSSRDAFTGVRVGDKVTICEDLGEPWNKADLLMGAGPTLVRNGNVQVTVQDEQFPGDITNGRAPRTALGIMANGHILLAVVDGRQDNSIGCTLAEMGALMKKFGAVDAMNFDGGGSSEMVLGGRVLNNPSDGAERSVGCALIVLKK